MWLERHVQKVRPGCWEALEEIEKRFNTVESRHGFPEKRRYKLYIGGGSTDTLIVERDWPSLAELEARYMECEADPEYAGLGKEVYNSIESVQVELYMRLP